MRPPPRSRTRPDPDGWDDDGRDDDAGDGRRPPEDDLVVPPAAEPGDAWPPGDPWPAVDPWLAGAAASEGDAGSAGEAGSWGDAGSSAARGHPAEADDAGSGASSIARAAGTARTDHAVVPVQTGPRGGTRIRLRVGVGAAVVLVGAALVTTILVTAVHAASGGTSASSPAASGAPAPDPAHGRGSADDGTASPGDPSGAEPGRVPGSGDRGSGPDDRDEAEQDGAAEEDGMADGAGGSPSTAPVYVHVVGAVVSPGLFPLAPGSRVVDAVAAAHGFAEGADTAGVNLARVLSDGEQLVVPRLGETPAAPAPAPAAGPGTAAAAVPSAPVDLNTATAEQLETLPRVGPSLAARIIAWRSAHGRFAHVADLGRVPGIGDRTLASLTPLVRV